MPRNTKKERIRCDYYTWLLGIRDGVFYADGRGNDRSIGRHSLGTTDRKTAHDLLRRLDVRTAVARGKVSAEVQRATDEFPLLIVEGWEVYLAHIGRPQVLGGVSKKTRARYRAVYDKFGPFAAARGIRYWSQVTANVLTAYGTWLHDEDYAGRTLYLELTTLKQLLNWLVQTKRLPSACDFAFEIKKQRGTNTYCYSPEEVAAMLAYCRATEGLYWLGDVIETLALTGLRISELAGLRWEQVKIDAQLLILSDTTRSAKKSELDAASRTKSHRARSLPLKPELQTLFARLTRRKDGFVFQGPNGGRLKPDTVRNILRRDVLATLAKRFPPGTNGRGIEAGRLHSFRHFFCSAAVNGGVPEGMLMEWLGHRDSDMIRHYSHLRPEEALRHMARVPSISLTVSSTTAAGQPSP